MASHRLAQDKTYLVEILKDVLVLKLQLIKPNSLTINKDVI